MAGKERLFAHPRRPANANVGGSRQVSASRSDPVPAAPAPADPTLTKTLKQYPDRDPVLQQASEHYGIPYNILYGVYGMETGFGANIATSTAGAVGAFQFLPSTAQGYAYPLTNDPSPLQFRQQTFGAAHYLHDLYQQYGSWDEALKHYSGGGYGLNEVTAKAKDSGDNLATPFTEAAKPFTDAAGAVADAAQIPAKFYDLITDVTVWIRLFEAIFGGLLIYFGLKQLTGA